jgi:hypothetical protein
MKSGWGMIAAVLASLLLGFACGYGVRAIIGGRRRAAARERYYQSHPHLRE